MSRSNKQTAKNSWLLNIFIVVVITAVIIGGYAFVSDFRLPNLLLVSTSIKNPPKVLLKYTKYAASHLDGVDINSQSKVINTGMFQSLVEIAKSHPRKRKMTDLTKDPTTNTMQVLMNTWTAGSFSPVHKHVDYSEAFVILDGALAFFTFNDDGSTINCNVLTNIRNSTSSSMDHDVAMIVERGQYHAMTAAPVELGYPGYSIIFEISGHVYNPSANTKALASFAPSQDDGMNGDPTYFETILKKCPRYKQ